MKMQIQDDKMFAGGMSGWISGVIGAVIGGAIGVMTIAYFWFPLHLLIYAVIIWLIGSFIGALGATSIGFISGAVASAISKRKNIGVTIGTLVGFNCGWFLGAFVAIIGGAAVSGIMAQLY
jgi:integral membrane sensor domain MASE1